MPTCHQPLSVFLIRRGMFLVLILGLGLPALSQTQFTISGPTCVVAGTQYTYTISGNWTNSTTMNWTAANGTISGNNSGTPLVQVHITWSGTTTGVVQVATQTPTGSGSLTVTLDDPLSGGTISNASQSINYNTVPATLSCSVASGGSCTPNYTYQWQSSTNNSTFTSISGATSQNLSFSAALTSTMYYRRMVTETTSGSTGYSNSATVIVYPQLVGGTTGPSPQTINYNTSPSALTVSGVTGGAGSGSYTYQWYSQPSGGSSSAIGGATGASYSPGALTTTTSFWVNVSSNGTAAQSSNTVINVYPPLISGLINPTSVNIGYNSSPGLLTLSEVSGGSGTYTYQWQSSATSSFSSPTTISGATATTYTPGNLTTTTYYRVAVTSNGATAYSGSTAINVYPQLNPGTLSPATSTIPYDGNPGQLKLSGVSGGSGSYIYIWQSSPDNVNWSNIAGAYDTTFYSPGNVGTTTYYRVNVQSATSAYSSTATVTVLPEIFPGIIGPSNVSILSGTSPGLLSGNEASGGNCGGSFTYQWQSSTNGTTWSAISGATGLTYSPGNLTATTYFKRNATCGTQTAGSNPIEAEVVSVADLNYIRVRDIHKQGVTDSLTAASLTSPYDVAQTTQYFDGLGRVTQTVAMQQTPMQKDMVTMNMYDNYGREIQKYLPFGDTSSSGNYKYSAPADQYSFNSTEYPNEQYYYGLVSYEPSDLNRPLTTYAQGMSWVGSNRGVGMQAQVNQASDSVRLWTIAYPVGSIPTSMATYGPGMLYKGVSTDEAGHQVVSYKDFQGRVVLKKIQLTGTPGTAHVGWLCTYYIYDDLGFLRFVIQPQAVILINGSWSISQTIANQLCFRYEYDQWGRMNIKKVPGAGEVHMVYDERDRLVMNQDSMLRAGEQWMVTSYDAQNRPDSTGLILDPSDYDVLSYHTSAAMSSPTYPPIQNYSYSPQTQTHYDDYAWVTALENVLTATMDTSYNSNSTYFITSYNSGPVYPVDQTPLMITRGQVTGTTQYLLGTTTAQFDVNFYDDRGRVIETQSTNYTNGLDKDINQYDFNGKNLRHLLVTHKNGNNSQAHTFCNEYTYDAAFRMTGIKDNVDGTLVTVDTLEYDELSHLRAKYLGGGMDSLVYSYNVRNWVTGINKNYVAGTANDYFGLELAYDKQTSVSTTTYAAAQYTGNITGLIWKSGGDGINRQYNFTYDTVNRLTGAGFLQNPSGSTWNKTAMDYTVDSLTYDGNGNILTMNQHGFKIGNATGLIDLLTYSYQATSNQLSQVVDGANDTASTLGDFHYKTLNSIQYTYDGNGNLKIDNNKGIDSIGYNYLNLPQYIHIKGKGTITYAYDATGMKEAKTVVDSTQNPVQTTTTKYIKNYQYTNDTLTQANFEEGRARWQKKYLENGDSIYSYFYDYFLKDHLGNTRVILTTQKDTSQYTATMEAANRATENLLFYNIDSTSYPTNLVPNHFPGDNASPNDSVAMVSGSTHPVGPAILLKVMDGDSISVGVNSYFVGTGPAGNTTSSIPNLLNTLANGLVSLGAGGGEQGTLATLGNASGGPVLTALNSFLPSYDSTPVSTPKAYLNWMLLDNQFNYVSGNGQSGAIHVGTAGTEATLATTIKMHHSGYLYIWVSNETQNWDVFFDNLSILHFAGPMLEETHYYPFGLTMAGISDKAVKTSYSQNKYRFSGKELQNQEFSGGTGLEEYDYGARMQDPQLGVWHTLDPLSDMNRRFSPYNFAENNPIRFIDPDGMEIDNPDVTEDASGITYTGKTAQEVFQILKERYPNQHVDPEKEVRDYLKLGDYDNAFRVLSNQPILRNFLNNDRSKLVDIVLGTPQNMEDAVRHNGESYHTGSYETIFINQSLLDDFRDNKSEFDFVLQKIFHEFVHAKQDLGLDGFKSHGNKVEDEFEAYYYEARNTTMKLSTYHQNTEYGWTPIRYLEGAGSASVINGHLSEIQYLLTRVTPQTAANIKKEIAANFKIKL